MMRRPKIRQRPQENLEPGAKWLREIRLIHGMRLLAALGGLFTLWLGPGCFDLKYSCRVLCDNRQSCPSSLHCVFANPNASLGLCAPPGAICELPPDAGDGASDGSIADGDASTGPPQMVCHKESCLPLSEAVRSNLVLLLWPSNLPPVDSTVTTWPDLSGHGNDALALNPSGLPTVIADGVKLAAAMRGAGFTVANSASIDFATEDFVVLVVAGVATGNPTTLFVKADGDRINPRRVVLERALFSPANTQVQASVNATTVPTGADVTPPSVNVYALRRTRGHVEMRVDNVVWGSADLADPQESTTNAADVFIGVGYDVDPDVVDTLHAVFALRGTVNSSDLSQIERFLRSSFSNTP